MAILYCAKNNQKSNIALLNELNQPTLNNFPHKIAEFFFFFNFVTGNGVGNYVFFPITKKLKPSVSADEGTCLYEILQRLQLELGLNL